MNKIIPYDGPVMTLTEIPQLIDISFAWAYVNEDGDYVQIMPFVLCRDYLHDVVGIQYYKSKGTIFGFTFNSKPEYGNPSTWKLLIKADNKFIKSNLSDYAQGQIVRIFKALAVPITIKTYIADGIYVITIPPSYFLHPSALHFITFLYRAVIYTKHKNTLDELIKCIKPLSTPEAEIASKLKPEVVSKLLSNLHLFEGRQLEVYRKPSSNELHNSGILTFMMEYGYNNTSVLGIQYLPK